jgi:hypothetical protein
LISCTFLQKKTDGRLLVCEQLEGLDARGSAKEIQFACKKCQERSHSVATPPLKIKRGTALPHHTQWPCPVWPTQPPESSAWLEIWYTRICASSFGTECRAKRRITLSKVLAVSTCPGYVPAGMRTKQSTAHMHTQKGVTNGMHSP